MAGMTPRDLLILFVAAAAVALLCLASFQGCQPACPVTDRHREPVPPTVPATATWTATPIPPTWTPTPRSATATPNALGVLPETGGSRPGP